MAYQTGTVASASALKTLIETFCTTNGYALASNWLSKGQTNVKLTATSATVLTIQGACDPTGTTNPSPYTRNIDIASGNWPVTYYLFYNASPDTIFCVLNYGSYCQVIFFTDIVKVNDSAYVGGNMFWASLSGDTDIVLYTFGETYLQVSNSINNPGKTGLVPFARSHNGGDVVKCGVHCEIDGNIWNLVDLSNTTKTLLYRNPNIWLGQTLLVPMHLIFPMSYWAYIGYIEHIRLVRVTNYNIGDEITLGSDTWKIFPWYLKDLSSPNGSPSTFSSGTLGFAVRKS